MFLYWGSKKDSKSHTSRPVLLKHSCPKGILLLLSQKMPKLPNGEKNSCPQLLMRPNHMQPLWYFLCPCFASNMRPWLTLWPLPRMSCPASWNPLSPNTFPAKMASFETPGNLNLHLPHCTQHSKNTHHKPELWLHLSRNYILFNAVRPAQACVWHLQAFTCCWVLISYKSSSKIPKHVFFPLNNSHYCQFLKTPLILYCYYKKISEKWLQKNDRILEFRFVWWNYSLNKTL